VRQNLAKHIQHLVTMATNNTTSLRDLNDYESMLATMTCNVGMKLSIQRADSRGDLETSLRQAWSRCVEERTMLQVKVVPIQGDIGPLGQRYTLEWIEEDSDSLFVVRQGEESSASDLARELQRIGTTALDISKGSYYVACSVSEEADNKVLVQVILSLCHSLSDGPGALRVAQSFLQHLGNIFQRSDTSNDNTAEKPAPQPLYDVQALILGSDYAESQDAKSVFVGQDDFAAALGSKPILINDATVLPPEAMQNLPSDDGFGGPSFIDCIHFTLTAQETTALRDACRRHGTTVQGAITAASIKTRAELLGLRLPVEAAVQVPVNTRSLVNVDPDACLCGSAGVWHFARMCQDEENLFDLAKRSTEAIQAALKDGTQPREWLRRLFHAPATLPPYSLMVSSIGVAPIESSYESVDVEQLFFFGGALRTDSPSQAQATMIHVVTFRDELTCMINFTSPGVAKSFVDDTARLLKATLLSMATKNK